MPRKFGTFPIRGRGNVMDSTNGGAALGSGSGEPYQENSGIRPQGLPPRAPPTRGGVRYPVAGGGSVPSLDPFAVLSDKFPPQTSTRGLQHSTATSSFNIHPAGPGLAEYNTNAPPQGQGVKFNHDSSATLGETFAQLQTTGATSSKSLDRPLPGPITPHQGHHSHSTVPAITRADPIIHRWSIWPGTLGQGFTQYRDQLRDVLHHRTPYHARTHPGSVTGLFPWLGRYQEVVLDAVTEASLLRASTGASHKATITLLQHLHFLVTPNTDLLRVSVQIDDGNGSSPLSQMPSSPANHQGLGFSSMPPIPVAVAPQKGNVPSSHSTHPPNKPASYEPNPPNSQSTTLGVPLVPQLLAETASAGVPMASLGASARGSIPQWDSGELLKEDTFQFWDAEVDPPKM